MGTLGRTPLDGGLDECSWWFCRGLGYSCRARRVFLGEAGLSARRLLGDPIHRTLCCVPLLLPCHSGQPIRCGTADLDLGFADLATPGDFGMVARAAPEPGILVV